MGSTGKHTKHTYGILFIHRFSENLIPIGDNRICSDDQYILRCHKIFVTLVVRECSRRHLLCLLLRTTADGSVSVITSSPFAGQMENSIPTCSKSSRLLGEADANMI